MTLMIEVSYRVYDDKCPDDKVLVTRSLFTVRSVATCRHPFSTLLVDKATRFWDSIVYMGVLDKL